MLKALALLLIILFAGCSPAIKGNCGEDALYAAATFNRHALCQTQIVIMQLPNNRFHAQAQSKQTLSWKWLWVDYPYVFEKDQSHFPTGTIVEELTIQQFTERYYK